MQGGLGKSSARAMPPEHSIRPMANRAGYGADRDQPIPGGAYSAASLTYSPLRQGKPPTVRLMRRSDKRSPRRYHGRGVKRMRSVPRFTVG